MDSYYNVGKSGTVTVDGVNGGTSSKLTSTNQFCVGYNGTGSLSITNGGQVSNTNGYVGGYQTASSSTSTGNTVTVDGSSGGIASKWTCGYSLYGSYGVSNGGSLTVTNGGSLYTGYQGGSQHDAYLGYGNTSTFSATVDGASSTWNENGTIFVGYGTTASGSLTISNGATVNTATSGTHPYVNVGSNSNNTGSVNILSGGKFNMGTCYIGNYYNGGTGTGSGTVTVDGSGSTLSTYNTFGNTNLYVGCRNNGTLNITNGGLVTTGSGYWSGGTYLGWFNYSYPTVISTLHFASGGTLNTSTLMGSPSQMSGTGTVTGCDGLVTDANLLFDGNDPTHGLNQSIPLVNSTGTVTVQMNDGTITGGGGSFNTFRLGVGYLGNGTLTFRNGITVSSGYGEIGWFTGSSGTALVTDGATWNVSILEVGARGGTGALYVRNGGKLTVSTGATATSVDVGRGSSVSADSVGGTMTVVAGASVGAANTYSPVSATTSWNAGTYQAVGGTWDVSNADGTGTHVFTASTVATGAAGSPISIDTNAMGGQQRMLFADSGSGKQLGISFLAQTASTPTSVTAAMAVGPAHSLNAWTFSAVSGYNPGDPAYLSLSIPSVPHGYYADSQPSAWIYDGTSWSAYAAADFSCDNTYANFTVNALATSGAGTGYAITGIAVIAGDANLDKTVDISDLGVVLNNYDASAGTSWASGDFNGDGTVDLSDLSAVLNNYNATAGFGGVRAVPEPGTFALLAAGLAALFACTWRKRR